MDASLLADDDALLAHAGIDRSLPERVGLFRDDGWLRRVSREPAVLFGGGCALLLEVAHPLVAAGVAEHSDFRRDPFAAGTSYRGRDPDLVLWVWATLVDTALAVYRDFVGLLDASALAEYHRDQRALALLLGAPADRTPGDPSAFRSWFDEMVAG